MLPTNVISARCFGDIPGLCLPKSASTCRVLGAPKPFALHKSNLVATRRSTVSMAIADDVVMDALLPDGLSGDAEFLNPTRDLKVLIAGAGIGGLVLAVALLKKGIKVQMFERDMTAIRGEGKYRGPIQIQSNALAALEAIDADMAAEVMAAGCVTGDRVNGLCDGVSGEWYVKFDTYHVAVDSGMPITRVISRVELQGILAKYARKYGGDDIITEDARVAAYEEDSLEGKSRVFAVLESGERFWGDILIGADGIWSKIRTQLIGPTDANYSQYTCYTGISDFVAADIDTVGYRVYLGNRQYFVSSDVGGGKMQWYAFHKEAAGGKDVEGRKKERLMEIFGSWHDMVTDLIVATPEEDVLRRDIYDRPPIFTWTKGRVALLGDSAHAMQPNLGQGGCMAIEDAYEMAKLIADQGLEKNPDNVHAVPVARILKEYENNRLLRASAIHGMAGMAAFAASTYKAYLGEGLGPLSWITKFQIPHPGRVSGQVVLKATMPFVLDWVLGGNKSALKQTDRITYCNLDDKPRGFAESQFGLFMNDDEALLKAANADWLLAPVNCEQTMATAIEGGITLGRDGSSDIQLSNPSSSTQHARIEVDDGKYYVVDCRSAQGTLLNKRRLEPETRTQLHPGDVIEVCGSGEGIAFRVKIMHGSQREAGLVTANPDGTERRLQVSTKSSRAASLNSELQAV